MHPHCALASCGTTCFRVARSDVIQGNQNGRKALEEYWETRDKAQPEKKKVEKARKIFDFYDSNHSGALEREQAKAYINDLLEVSNIKNSILREAAEKQRSGEEYYMEFLNEVFLSLVRLITHADNCCP